MNEDEIRSVIERYLHAYNTFDIDGMISVIHPDIIFKNVSGEVVTATATGAHEFKKLADQSKNLFSARQQTIVKFRTTDDRAFIEVNYEGTLSSDLPNGMEAGETLRLKGRSELIFRDGRIYRMTDYS